MIEINDAVTLHSLSTGTQMVGVVRARVPDGPYPLRIQLLTGKYVGGFIHRAEDEVTVIPQLPGLCIGSDISGPNPDAERDRDEMQKEPGDNPSPADPATPMVMTICKQREPVDLTKLHREVKNREHSCREDRLTIDEAQGLMKWVDSAGHKAILKQKDGVYLEVGTRLMARIQEAVLDEVDSLLSGVIARNRGAR